MGAPVLMKTKEHNPTEIAKMEFEKNVLPITVKRSMPKRVE